MSSSHADRLKGSEERLWRLIEERCAPGADVREIDRRIWDLFGEEWAVMFTDLAGFSRAVAEFGIIHFLQIIHEHHRLLVPILEQHDGLLIKTDGDSLIILFRRIVRALECAAAMQRACLQVNERRRPEEQILLCVGIGYGRLLHVGDIDVWGQELNSAAKLGEDTARAGDVLLTASARNALGADADRFELEAIDTKLVGSESCWRLGWNESR
jgi:class 3 adenylate cyclase